ncbi:nuclear transport factor 2 family protein [Streptomyces sp. NPDC059819]|uniref:nuclear transport factor 2 family protein n=1 Tax=Streptomyces sp. NPDC059819 TaxID=3346963 RepID=UPI003651D798
MADADSCEARRPLFELLGELATVDSFFGHVSDDVQWTMVGRHPLAGKYRNKKDFLDGTLEQVRSRSGGLCFRLKQMYGTSSFVTVVMEGVATATDGRPYDPFYVWLCRFEGDTIVEVQAYVDTMVVTDLIDRVPSGDETAKEAPANAQAEARRTAVPGPLQLERP